MKGARDAVASKPTPSSCLLEGRCPPCCSTCYSPRQTVMSTIKRQHIERAISQFTDRPPVPEIDFTQHFLDDGTVVNTQERVVKDVRVSLCVRPWLG